MNNLFQNNYESDNDERLDKKFSYNYQVIKRMYPKASELPEEEVRGIIRKYYQAPKGQEEQVIKDYISQKEPEWQTKYFAEDDENNTLLSPITRMRRQRAKGFLHQSSPETSNMLMDYQALDTSDMLYGAATNNNYQMQKDKEENVDSMPQSSDSAKSFGDYFMDNVADIGYGAKKALSGMTFGASDWIQRRLGLDNEQEYLAKKQAEGLGGLTKGLGVASEIGGNILGAGGALVKGLQNLGWKGYGLAGAAGGIEGAAYGLTGSDRLADVPENLVSGAGFGAVSGALGEGAGRALGSGLRGLKYVLSRNPNKAGGRALYGLTEQLAENTGNRLNAENLVNNALNDAERTGRSLIEVADEPIVDIAQQARQKTPAAGYMLQNRLNQAREAQPAELRSFVNDVLGTSSRGNSVAEVTAKAQAKARPIYQKLDNLGDLARYEIKNKLNKILPERYHGVDPVVGKSPREYVNLAEQELNKAGLTMAKGNPDLPNGGINHLVLNETGDVAGRAPYINTLSDTINAPDIHFSQGEMENFVRPIRNNTNDKRFFDNVVLKNGEVYTKYPTRASQLAGHLRKPTDNLSIGGSLLDDMGISPSSSGINSISNIGRIVNSNNVIQDTIKRVKKANSSLRDLPDTDFRVLNEARKALSDQSRNMTDLSGYEARAALKELDGTLDEIIPEYAQARRIYSDAHKFEEAADLSKKVFSGINPEDFRLAVQNLSQPERDALAIGLRDDLLQRLGARENQALGFKGLMTQNVQDKMRYALGNRQANKIIGKAEEALNLNRNYNRLLQGSQTSEKQALRDKANMFMNILKNPTGVIGELINPFAKASQNRANNELARALTSVDMPGLRQGLNWYRGLQDAYQFNPVYGIALGSQLGKYAAEEF